MGTISCGASPAGETAWVAPLPTVAATGPGVLLAFWTHRTKLASRVANENENKTWSEALNQAWAPASFLVKAFIQFIRCHKQPRLTHKHSPLRSSHTGRSAATETCLLIWRGGKRVPCTHSAFPEQSTRTIGCGESVSRDASQPVDLQYSTARIETHNLPVMESGDACDACCCDGHGFTCAV